MGGCVTANKVLKIIVTNVLHLLPFKDIIAYVVAYKKIRLIGLIIFSGQQLSFFENSDPYSRKKTGRCGVKLPNYNSVYLCAAS